MRFKSPAKILRPSHYCPFACGNGNPPTIVGNSNMERTFIPWGHMTRENIMEAMLPHKKMSLWKSMLVTLLRSSTGDSYKLNKACCHSESLIHHLSWIKVFNQASGDHLAIQRFHSVLHTGTTCFTVVKSLTLHVCNGIMTAAWHIAWRHAHLHTQSHGLEAL